MCLLVFAWRVHPELPLVFAGNRDEFHDRPAEAAHWWREPEGMLGGKDLKAGGSWLGIHRNGRFAVVTNYREPAVDTGGMRSRGDLVLDSLASQAPLVEWTDGLATRRDDYGGFNLIVGDGERLHYLTNRGDDRLDLAPGIYGLSNRRLNTPWPKVTTVRDGLSGLIDTQQVDSGSLFDLLADRTPVPDDKLPRTGVPLEWERALSAVFIAGPRYGTRACTVVLIREDGRASFWERRFEPEGDCTGEEQFELTIRV